jgi:hypothetical protein
MAIAANLDPATAPTGSIINGLPAIAPGAGQGGTYDPGTPTPPSASATPTGPSAGQTPYVPPTPGPDQITTSAGFTPDYTGAIQSDPSYAAAQTGVQKSNADAAAQRAAALKAAVIQYGGLPDGVQDAYGDIDQATLDAAKGNQYSTLAALARNHQQSVEQFRRALAARGALQSGDLSYGQDQLDTGYGQGQYDAANQFGGAASGVLNQYGQVVDQNMQSLASAIAQAQQNAYADPMNRPVAANTAARDASKSALYGTDIYVAPDGTMYTRDGSVYTPPPPSASPAAYGYGAGPYSWGIAGKL